MNSPVITIPTPDFGSNLTNIILDLEKLRTKKLAGNVPPHIFFQLKEIFQILETIGSARIEGNNTTLAEYIEKRIENSKNVEESEQEIRNINDAIKFIEENVDDATVIDRALISEIHKIVTKKLTPPPKGEGSNFPGKLRPHNVTVSHHVPPDVAVLQEHFDEFVKFIRTEQKEQYQLLQVAIAHHRFAYIHMFDNGNGRMGRLLNYLFLIKIGFKVKNGRIINPSSVFYSDRDKYYKMLGKADSLKDSDLLNWCEYFLLGIKNEVEKIDSLLNLKYVQEKILLPAISYAKKQEYITSLEFSILKYIVNNENMVMKSSELDALGITDSVKKSRIMAALRKKGFIRSLKEGSRIYTIHFLGNFLLRCIIKYIKEEGFVADFLNKNASNE